jgi:hypothetical protein
MSSFVTMLDTLLRSSGMDAQDIARQVPCHPAHLSNLRRGRKKPSYLVAERLDDLLGANSELLAAAVSDGLPADRPAVLAAIGAVIDPAEATELARRLRASDVDAGTLDGLARTTEALCTQYAWSDPMRLRRETLLWLGYTDHLLDGRIGLREHRELLVAAGWLTLLVSCLEYDSGMTTAAEATRVSAMHLGREAGHGEIVAWSWEIASWMAQTHGDPAKSAVYARAGQEAAPRSSVAVQLAAHEARALARMGDPAAAGQVMDRGRKLLNQIRLPSNKANHFVIDPGKLDFYAMEVARTSGNDQAASEYANEVLRPGAAIDGEDTSPMRMSEARLTLAMVAARRNDLDDAAALGKAAFESDRKCFPSLLLVAGELEDEMTSRSADARPVKDFSEHLAEVRLMLPSGA